MENVRSKIKIDSFADKLLALDKSDVNYNEKYHKLIFSYLVELEEILENESIAFNVVALDFLSENARYIHLGLVRFKNPKIMNALLVIEKIRGTDAFIIQKDLDEARRLFYSGDYGHMDKKDLDYVEAFYKYLGEYLQGKENVNKLQDDLTLEFYQNIEPVIGELFANYRNHYLPRNNFIDRLFDLSDINTISNVFGLLENINLPSTYDYKYVILRNINFLSSVKGLFKKCNSDVFANFLKIGKRNFGLLDQLLREIVQLNQSDEEGLKVFFQEAKEQFKHQLPLYFQLRKQDYYQKYTNVDFNSLCAKNLQRFLNGDTNIDEMVIKKIGQYKGFIQQFDQLLQLFVDSKDEVYKRKLILPLVVAAIEKEKKNNKLKFEIVFTSNNINPREVGHYSLKKNVLYINPLIFDYFNDLDYTLVESFNTLFHEVRHAKQFQEAKTSNAFDFDNLIQAIDLYLFGEDYDNSYYTDNYEHISFERDAREVAYVKTMMAFEKYPHLLDMAKKMCDKGDYFLSSYMRKRLFAGQETYYGIIYYFVKEVNAMFDCYKRYDQNGLIREMIKKLKTYPVFFQFFDLDEKNFILKVKSDGYFKKMTERVQKMPDSSRKRQMEYSLKAFTYGLKVGEYFENNDKFFPINNGYNDEIIKEVINAVGSGVTR